MNREIKFRAWDSEQKVMRDHSQDPQIIQVVIFGNDSEGRIKLMQFTGLKDKNGKEIYEGDILKSHIYNELALFTCGFKDGAFVFYYKTGVIQHNPQFFEVIGNAYENPDLLQPPRGER